MSTQGHDVHHLMQAIEQMGSAFRTRIVVTLLAAGLVLVFVAFVLVIVFAPKVG